MQTSSVPQLNNADLFGTHQFIGGAWSEPNDEDLFEVIDPGTASPWVKVKSSSLKDVDAAINAAHAAFPTYSQVPARERARKLLDFDRLLRENLDDIATLLVWETGKPFDEAKGEVEYALTFSWWYIGEVERVQGQTVKGAANAAIRFFTIKQPIGPVALLTPWNFPVALFVRKVVTALAAGCTVVAKPSPEAPLSTLAVARLLEQAGFGNGIVNVILASNKTTPAIGELLCSDRRIKKVSFTGSTRVGRIVMRQCALSLKKLTLELGGLGAYLVFNDADVDKACVALVANKTRHAGQTCIAAQRVFVHRSISDVFAQGLLALLSQVKLGHGLDPSTTLGPLETLSGKEKAIKHIEDARRKGAQILTAAVETPTQGFFVTPTVVLGCTKDMLVFQEESFAPIINLTLFDAEEEAIQMANDTDMGLTSYVFTKDASRLWRCYESLKAGNVGLNVGNTTSAEIPFGGLDQSGFGKEAGIGAGLSEYLIEKSATMAL
ncbi:aldehyde dehydrogenase [Tilletiaria anomala UBC 951]|uniref:Aldehyde dehydrogenase n=1 Tax=Tilletiaria anomala (strain ATCC 24038 / CBS 436.72 / UBC 951) TaxID=1037660 RepID=A0A066W6R0_TILAU|nr:aldehyde dehydrogenase [Tilletiaria anomala UBC 951]KDN46455.1 aldehyde dehydrogenase [Tilletiaria anomala UBC 951]